MTISELEQRIDLLSLIEQEHKVKRVGSNLYRTNICPKCGSKKGFTIYQDTNSYNSFCGCYQGGSIYKYLMEVKGMNEDEAYQELLELSGHGKSPIISKPAKAKEKIEPSKNYTNTILELYNEQTEKDKEYFINRGLSLDVIDKYKLCIGSTRKLNNKFYDTRAIIPIWKGEKVVYFNARSLESNPKIKYLKATGKSIYMNMDYLDTASKGETIILTESEFDSLSLESIGIKSIAIGGVDNYNNFMEQLKRNDLFILTAFDNDDKGQKIKSKYKINIPGKYKDINEWIIDDKESFKSNINNQIEAYKKPDSLINYLNNGFIKDMNSYKEFKDRKTGFKNLDNITSLYPGLYVLGGLSTLGKTTFIHQMSDQLAERGEHILFFSLEMSKLELITKSISRLTVNNQEGHTFNDGVSALDIRLNNLGNKASSVHKAIDNYSDTSKRFNIIEGNFNTNIFSIRNNVEKYIAINKVKPVVIIDYLQIIPGDKDSFSDKDKVDKIVTGLKQMSRDFNISVVVISSFNRSNYLTPVDFESFKESGGIEYSADVVWGLQLQAIHNDIFNKQSKIKEKREIINEAKKATPRQVELVCLKNRNGISNYRCGFSYYPKYDLFLADEDTSIKTYTGGVVI